MWVEDIRSTMGAEDTLIERRRKPVSADGLLRLPISIYREWGEPAEVTFDLVEVDGATEVRLRVQ